MPKKRGGRGQRSQQRYFIRRFLFQGSNVYIDRTLKETICLVNSDQVYEYIKTLTLMENSSLFKHGILLSLCDYIRGEVLADTYGRGSLQNPERKQK